MRRTHGHTAHYKVTPEYRVWANMIQRCTNPKRRDYRHYGGRGITVCERWRMFENFLEDMGQRPVGSTLERMNNSLGYCKENCCWASKHEQAANKRNNRLITHNGETHHLCEWARIKGINFATIWERLQTGWTVEAALERPPDRTAIHKAITHCPHGHEYTPDNIVVQINKGYPCRRCKQCNRDRHRRNKAKVNQ